LAVGDQFTVGIKQFGLPYKITSTVTGMQDDKNAEGIISTREQLARRFDG
jgi:hypothetical protein